jgi:hypothetical protein
MKLQLKKHHGIVLDVGEEGSNDAGAATFASSFVDPDKPEKMHLFYSASTDVDWSFSTIRLAFADSDWASFKKSPPIDITQKSGRIVLLKRSSYPIRG